MPRGEIAELADTINGGDRHPGDIRRPGDHGGPRSGCRRETGRPGKRAGRCRDLERSDGQRESARRKLDYSGACIAEVATAVTKGTLRGRSPSPHWGDVAALTDNINEMIRNLKDTTLKNAEQDWLKTNLAKFSRMLQGQKDLLTVGRLILSELAPVVSAQQGVFYIMDTIKQDESYLRLLASYAYKERKNIDNKFKLGEGLVGQCALEKEKILLTDAPADYIKITSGLGEARPLNIIVLPIVFEGQVKAVMELASFDRFSPTHETFLDQLTESIGIVLHTIEANMRTEDLLKQSQSLARELQSQQEELQQTNAELEEKAKLLADQNVEVERKNSEVEQARQALEEKAKQLILTSLVQERIPGEHVARIAHAAEFAVDPLRPVVEERRRQPHGSPGGIHQDHSLLRQRPPDVD